jgi:hypothetical protein
MGTLLDVVTTGPTTVACVKPSHNHFDARAVAGRLGEWGVAGDHRRIKRLCQSNVHGVVRCHVLAQLPRSSEKIEMGVTVEVEVDEVLDRLGRTLSRHFARSNEASEALRNFDVDQMGRMELVVSKEAGLDPSAEGVWRRNSSSAEASTTITRTRAPHG